LSCRHRKEDFIGLIWHGVWVWLDRWISKAPSETQWTEFALSAASR
jgi:hypothetical protein